MARGRTTLALAVAIVAGTVVAGAVAVQVGGGGGDTKRAEILADAPVVTPCGAKSPGDVVQAQPAPAGKAVVLIDGAAQEPKLEVSSLRILAGRGNDPDRVYVLAGSGRVAVYDLATGGFRAAFAVAVPGIRSSMAVDPDGNVYLGGHGGLYKFSPQGALLWQRPPSGVPGNGIYGHATREGFRIGLVVTRPDGPAGSDLFDVDGNAMGQSPVVGTNISVDPPTGDLLSTDGHYVRTYGPNGTLRSMFGSSLEENASGPFHFRLMGGAVKGPDGTVYVTSGGNGILGFTADGLSRGVAADRGPVGTMTQGATMELHDGRIYYATGEPFAAGQSVSSLPVEEIEALVDAPKAIVPRLGVGAGLATSATAGYFPAGTSPEVHVTFEPWWTAHARDVKGEYTVREHRQVLEGRAVPVRRFAVPERPDDLTIPLVLPPAAPGYYEVEARLLKGDRVVSADCLHYSVGMAGGPPALSGLPAGADFGGAKPDRSVALAGEMGFDLVRAGVDWKLLLPDPTSTGPIDFSAYDAELRAAARRAASSGVTFEVQLGGNPVEKALVENGTWGTRVQEMVEHFKADVHVWEAWNEPNNSFGPAEQYLERVLAPFSSAVKAADPTATVVGGSVLGMDLPYWDTIGKAGGFGLMDAVAIHPYTGHNRSVEEQGLPGELSRFKELLAAYGALPKPIWNTESAWVSDGPANFYSQADKVVRSQMLMRDAGVSKWAYFILEGGYGDYGLTYSLLQTPTATAPEVLKPAGLAAITYRVAVGGRPYRQMLPTGVPHTYAALFGPDPRATVGDNLVALWADDYATELSVQVPGGGRGQEALQVTEEMGGTTEVPVRSGGAVVAVDGSPRYVRVPGAGAPEVRGVEPFGPDVALASAGARATASSEGATNPASAAIDGVSDAQGAPEFPGLSAWVQAPGDSRPALTVTLPSAQAVDRVLVSSHSLGSVVSGVRRYDVQVKPVGGPWTTVARVRDQFYQRRNLVRFDARVVTDIRITGITVNLGGYAGGARPPFWPTDRPALTDPKQVWFGPAVVYEVEVYGAGEPVTHGAS